MVYHAVEVFGQLTANKKAWGEQDRCVLFVERDRHFVCLPGFNFNVEEWFEGDRYETLAICRTLAFARAAFEVAIAEKPAARFMIRQRTRVVKRNPPGDW